MPEGLSHTLQEWLLYNNACYHTVHPQPATASCGKASLDHTSMADTERLHYIPLRKFVAFGKVVKSLCQLAFHAVTNHPCRKGASFHEAGCPCAGSPLIRVHVPEAIARSGSRDVQRAHPNAPTSCCPPPSLCKCHCRCRGPHPSTP